MPSLSDLDFLSFLSVHPIDKIVTSGTTSIVNSGATTQAPQTAFIVSSSIANPYGRAAFVRAVFSVDGGASYQSLDSQLTYTFNLTVTPPGITVTLSGLQAAMSIGVSDSIITFVTANGYHGNVTDTGTYTYTPISQTFDIKYAVFERA